MEFPVRPVDDQVIIEPIRVTARKIGNVYVTGGAAEIPDVGRVAAAGPGAWDPANQVRLPMPVSPGQYVYYTKYAGSEIDVNGIKYVAVRQHYVIGVIDRAALPQDVIEDFEAQGRAAAPA